MSLLCALSFAALAQTLSVSATQVLDVGTVRQHRAPRPQPPARPLVRAVRNSVIDALPVGWRLGRLELMGDKGRDLENFGADVSVRAPLPEALIAGDNYLDVDVYAQGRRQARLAARVQLLASVVPRGVPVFARGQEVVVVVRTGNVTVQTKGVAQQAAAVGERIFVLPTSGTRTVQAVVRDASTVEVLL